MILNLREFDSFPAHKVLEGDPEKFSLDLDGVLGIRKLLVRLAIQESSEEYYCQGEVEATVRLECSRCLAQFETEMLSTIDFVVCSEGMYAQHRDQALDNEDYAFFCGSNRDVDLSAIIRQAILVEVPMMPLCSEDCRGLCDNCGLSLNNNDCKCDNEEIDERWEDLKRLSGINNKNHKE